MSFSEEFKNNCKKYSRGQALIDIIENKLKNDSAQIIYNIPDEFNKDYIALETLKKALDDCRFCEVIMTDKQNLGMTLKFAPRYMYYFFVTDIDNFSEKYTNYYTNNLKKVSGIVITA